MSDHTSNRAARLAEAQVDWATLSSHDRYAVTEPMRRGADAAIRCANELPEPWYAQAYREQAKAVQTALRLLDIGEAIGAEALAAERAVNRAEDGVQ